MVMKELRSPSYYRERARERVRFAQPTSRDVHPVDPVLTDISIGFKNSRFLWDQIAPVAPRDEKTGQITLYTRDFWMRRQEGAERAPNRPYLRVGYGVEFDSYNCIEIGFEKPLDDVERDSSQLPEDLTITDTAFVTNLIQLELEKRVAEALFITGVWGTSTTLTGGNKWSDYAASDPIADAETAKRVVRRGTGANPNLLFLGDLGWSNLKEHPLILDKYKHTQDGVMTEALVAAVLGIDEIVVGDSVENTAAEGASYVGADIWTDNALFLVKNNPGLQVANGAYTYIWNQKGNVPWGIENYREEGTNSEITRAFTHIDPNVVSSQHGYLYLDLN